ncbi:substrate-binding domain-containing protein [Azotobacter salinestris]|uniref:substrate-binding domain-containing protein n=1 Tax=Azotobacter salinestris TaxID=69964 RepID=UPI001266BDF4|nr:substrate-binding domain-containing protein [Azotobacter salinestris]
MKRSLHSCFLWAAALFCGLQVSALAEAEPLRFALIAKRVDQTFFIQAAEGCAQAAQTQGDTCLLLGTSGPTHFRRQNEVLEQALDMHLDGIALAVTHSKWLAEHALRRLGKTPLITLNSDFAPEEQHLRQSYVGLDNLAFGQQLGGLAQHFRPKGGKLCILTGSPQETNLQTRIRGIRQQLRGGRVENGTTGPLQGENGWSELKRCPLYQANDPPTALLKLATLLNSGSQVDAIITPGSWLVYEAEEFRRQIAPILAELDQKGTRPVIIMTINEPDAAQLALLEDGLVQAYLAIKGREIGRESYRILKRLAQGEPVPEEVFIDSHVYLPKAPMHIGSER